MKISIKFKFSVFLAALLLLTVFVLSLLVLQGIRANQRHQIETYFAQQAEMVNVYFIQSLLTEEIQVPKTYLQEKGAEFAQRLQQVTGQAIVLYDKEGMILGRRGGVTLPSAVQQTLAYALDNKIAYLEDGASLYYLTPLRAGTEQVGVVQFNYSLADNQQFYREIRQLFLTIGAGVFVLSFLLGYLYFNTFARGIIRLKKTVEGIGAGKYEASALRRRDELGDLSAGIRGMSDQIQGTLLDKEREQEKLSLAVQKLSQLGEQQRAFIGGVTHEFKTPLTSIKAYLDLLDMYPDDADLLKTALVHMQGETTRLYEMVEKVLQLSLLEKYDFELSWERLDLEEIIQAVLGSLKGKMDKFDIHLSTQLEKAYVRADKDCMTIVLVNLLDNAIKYNHSGGSIMVRLELQHAEVVIELEDTGIGVPEETVERIFEPFYTVDKNRARENGGVGLGLSLARKYTEIQGGTLSLVRTGETGSLFRIIFPSEASDLLAEE